jgi:hypothetical protein
MPRRKRRHQQLQLVRQVLLQLAAMSQNRCPLPSSLSQSLFNLHHSFEIETALSFSMLKCQSLPLRNIILLPHRHQGSYHLHQIGSNCPLNLYRMRVKDTPLIGRRWGSRFEVVKGKGASQQRSDGKRL